MPVTVKKGLNVLPANIKKRAIANIKNPTDETGENVLSLVRAFPWPTTKEGHDYWYAVHQKYFLNLDVKIPKPLK